MLSKTRAAALRKVEHRGAPARQSLLVRSRNLPDFHCVRYVVEFGAASNTAKHSRFKLRTSSTGAMYFNMIKRRGNNKYICVQYCKLLNLQPAEPKNPVTTPPAKPRTRVQCSFFESVLTDDADSALRLSRSQCRISNYVSS